jgi:hypothetical protein
MKENGPEINGEKTDHTFMSRRQNSGQNRNIKMANRLFENVSHFRYLGMIVTNQNFIQEEIKSISNSGNACYHSNQNLHSSRLLSKNVKIITSKIITMPVVLHACETWSLTLREEHRLRVFVNGVLR